MSHEITISPQSPVDASIEPPDVVEVPMVDGGDVSITVEPPDHAEVVVESSVPTTEAQVEVVSPLVAQVSISDGVEAQVISGGFITIVQDGGDVGFVEWAQYSYLDAGINLVKTLLAGQIVEAIRVKVLEAFDGSPTVEVGSAADPDLWLSLGSLELGVLCEYHNEGLTVFPGPEQINLSLSSPGSTKGLIGLLYRVVG